MSSKGTEGGSNEGRQRELKKEEHGRRELQDGEKDGRG